MTRMAGVALAVIAVLAGLAIGAIPAASQGNQRTTITALDLDRDDRSVDVDNNKKGFGSGDMFGFTSPLLDPEDRSRIGGLKAMCTSLTASRKTRTSVLLCQAEATFPEGKIAFSGSLKFSRESEGATFVITGGTEDYEGAAGTVELDFQNNGALTTFDFVTG